jgi:hypothetical protein
VEHAVVGDAVGVYGDDAGPILAVGQLPECDVLEMDCEGAELGILRAMVIRPRAVLVETHGNVGGSSSEVAVSLGRLGYRVSDYGLGGTKIGRNVYLERCAGFGWVTGLNDSHTVH